MVVNKSHKNFIIIFMLLIALKQAICCYKLEINRVSRAYSIAAVFKFCATCNVISPAKYVSYFNIIIIIIIIIKS